MGSYLGESQAFCGTAVFLRVGVGEDQPLGTSECCGAVLWSGLCSVPCGPNLILVLWNHPVSCGRLPCTRLASSLAAHHSPAHLLPAQVTATFVSTEPALPFLYEAFRAATSMHGEASAAFAEYKCPAGRLLFSLHSLYPNPGLCVPEIPYYIQFPEYARLLPIPVSHGTGRPSPLESLEHGGHQGGQGPFILLAPSSQNLAQHLQSVWNTGPFISAPTSCATPVPSIYLRWCVLSSYCDYLCPCLPPLQLNL